MGFWSKQKHGKPDGPNALEHPAPRRTALSARLKRLSLRPAPATSGAGLGALVFGRQDADYDAYLGDVTLSEEDHLALGGVRAADRTPTNVPRTLPRDESRYGLAGMEPGNRDSLGPEILGPATMTLAEEPEPACGRIDEGVAPVSGLVSGPVTASLVTATSESESSGSATSESARVQPIQPTATPTTPIQPTPTSTTPIQPSTPIQSAAMQPMQPIQPSTPIQTTTPPSTPPIKPTTPPTKSSPPSTPDPLTPSIFERDVQDLSADLHCEKIPAHRACDDYIPPVLTASTEVLANSHLDPESVVVLRPSPSARSLGQRSVSSHGGKTLRSFSMSSGSASPPQQQHHHQQQPPPPLPNLRVLSFCSFADLVSTENAVPQQDNEPLFFAARKRSLDQLADRRPPDFGVESSSLGETLRRTTDDICSRRSSVSLAQLASTSNTTPTSALPSPRSGGTDTGIPGSYFSSQPEPGLSPVNTSHGSAAAAFLCRPKEGVLRKTGVPGDAV